MMPSSGLRLTVVHQLRSPNSTASSQSCPNLSVGNRCRAPDRAQAEHDALLGAEADGGARQAPRRRVHLSRPPALAAARQVHRCLWSAAKDASSHAFDTFLKLTAVLATV